MVPAWHALVRRFVCPPLYGIQVSKKLKSFFSAHCYRSSVVGSFHDREGGGPRVVVSTAAFHARVRSRLFERNKNVSSPSTCESQYCGEPP